MNKPFFSITISIIFILVGIWFYSYNKYAGKYIGFKCGDRNENNVFILNSDGTFVFKSDNLSSNIIGKWAVSKEEGIIFTNKEKGIQDIGTIVRYNLHTNREDNTKKIPYAKGCRVYIGPK